MQNTVYSFFKNIVDKFGNKPAIIESKREYTFSELSDIVDKIAGSFPGGTRRVGIVMSHRIEMIAAIFAVLKCGASYVPAEPDFPIGRIRYMMEEAEVDFILTEASFVGKLGGFPTRLIDCEICRSTKDNVNNKSAATPHSPAYVLYTSGTTGRPKGVCVTNGNICHYVKAFANEFKPAPGDVMLQYSVCSFDIFVEEVFASLLSGAALAIPSANEKENMNSLMNFVKKHRVTIISGFPYLLAEMNKLAEIPSCLRLLISGGDVLRAGYVDRLVNRITVYNTYGPSETTVCAAYYNCSLGEPLEDGTYPIGHPVEGAEIRILDKSGKELLPGEPGEICILGGGVSEGYVGDHAEENRAFEYSSEGVMYHSGDLGYILPNGDLAFLHRMDTQIMIYGKRVEIAETESVLCGCAGVSQGIVRAFKDEDGLSYMIAYYVPARNNIKISEIRKEMADRLTPFMIPEFFVKINKIPLNSHGKPDINSLPVVMKEGSLI